MLIVVPIPTIFRFGLSTDNENPEIGKIKRIATWFICYSVCVVCFLSALMCSIVFDHNTSQIWLLNFAITTVVDRFLIDTLVALIVMLIYRKLSKKVVKVWAEIPSISISHEKEYSGPCPSLSSERLDEDNPLTAKPRKVHKDKGEDSDKVMFPELKPPTR